MSLYMVINTIDPPLEVLASRGADVRAMTHRKLHANLCITKAMPVQNARTPLFLVTLVPMHFNNATQLE